MVHQALCLPGVQPAAGGRPALHARPVPRTSGTATGAARSSRGCARGSPTCSTTGWPIPRRLGRRRRLPGPGADSWPGWMPSTPPGTCTTSSRASGRSSGARRTPILLVQGPPGTGKSYFDGLRRLRPAPGGDAEGRRLPGLPVLQDPRGDRRAAARTCWRSGRRCGSLREDPVLFRQLLRRPAARCAAVSGWPRTIRRPRGRSPSSRTPRRRRGSRRTPT